MPNLCEGCKLTCCQNFTVDTEKYEPRLFKQTLSQYPFIIRTGKVLIHYNSQEFYIGIYKCDRFNTTTGECQDYDTVPRPSFCSNTGKFKKSHPDCLL